MRPPPCLTFQSLLTALNQHWANCGCAILQPYDLEVGAATFHPATFLRAIGPQPWSAAYIQSSRRPKDGRYGQNPNRLGQYYQYQVVLKPSPDSMVDLYLQSLAAIGIDACAHDIRFVEDNWESPTLGAWGLGWEVWIDGMEISQFTYFQQVGGLDCQPVTGEITYGLERLAMYLQGVDNVYDLLWTDTMGAVPLGYWDIHQQNEVEQSIYNFEAADTALWETLFNSFEQECTQLIARGLSLPAYEYVIKCSHAFNVLEARAAISVTERAMLIKRIRTLACQVANTYYQSRKGVAQPLHHLAQERLLP